MTETETPVQPLTDFSRNQWIVLTIMSISTFLGCIIWSLQAPFYPKEAERKGLSPTEYGMVFGIYELVVFIITPLLSKVFRWIEPATAFRIGCLTSGTSTLAFGFINHADGRTSFLALSLTIRLLESVGQCLVALSNYAFVAIVFPGTISTVFAILETMFAVAMATGPPVGGFLYHLGGESFGFTLPFLVMGILILVTTACAHPFLPKKSGESEESKQAGKDSNLGFFSLLKIIPVCVYAVAIFAASMCSGFLTSTLEPHLRQEFSLIPYEVGLVFLIYGAAYAVTAALWGHICDRISHPEHLTLVGSVTILISFIMIGPASFIPIESSLGLTGASLSIFGAGQAAVWVSTFLLLLKEAWRNGFPKSASTSAACTAIWMSCQSLGAFIGPSAGGYLLENVGFRVGTWLLIGLFIIVTIMLTILISVRSLLSPPAVATDLEVPADDEAVPAPSIVAEPKIKTVD